MHLHGVRVIALAITLALLPFAVVLAYFTTDVVFSYAVNVYLFDLAQAPLVAAAAPLVLERTRARAIGLGTALWCVLLGLVALSFVFHPSVEGVQTLWRLCGALAIAATYTELSSKERGLVVGALTVGAIIESGWAIAQLLHGGPLGATLLFESQKPLPRAGDVWLPKGSMQTPYLLTTLALVGAMLAAARYVRDRAGTLWIVAVAAAVVPVGITYSRAALGAVGPLVAGLAPAARSDARRRLVLGALIIGIGVPALLTASGWISRFAQFGEDQADSGRGIILLQGLVVLSMDPLVGVGPGQYMARVRTLTTDATILRELGPTHDVPLLVAAESGIFAGAAVLVLLAALGRRVVRDRDDVAFGLYFALLPFWLLDVIPYTLPQGVILTGVWLGALDVLHRERSF